MGPMPPKKMVPPDAFRAVIDGLYPKEMVHLQYDKSRPWTLLFAVILSAQCTDARVNTVTPKLFTALPDLEAFVAQPVELIREQIASISFPNNKAKALKGASEKLLLEHNGVVPNTMEELTALPGVGRKTANVALSVLYGINLGFVVDTHIGRIARRCGHTRHTDPVKVEKDLMRRHPQNRWGSLSHKLVQFGRDWCDARKPKCGTCPMRDLCPKRGVQKEYTR